MNYRYKKTSGIILLCLMLVLMSCRRNSDTAADPVTADSAPESTMQEETKATQTYAKISVEPHDVSREKLQTDIDTITGYTRYIGTEGEKAAVDIIESTFLEYGYETAKQEIDYVTDAGSGETIKGTNIIAVKLPEETADTGDILILSAHHDTVMGTAGANDNASGLTALLELARVLKDADTDTEIRFISFSGEEVGRVGSRNYVDSLSDDEKDRIIGDIQLDMLGYYNDYEIELGTVDGEPVMIGNLLKGNASAMLHSDWQFVHEEMSDHSSFARYQIPAVVISQNVTGYENHTTQDKPGIVSVAKIKPVVEVLARTAADIMSTDTGTLIEEAQAVNPKGSQAFVQQKDNVIYFGMDYIFTENEIGLTGNKISETTDETGDTYSTYSYPMKWFGYDNVIETNYIYRNGYLEQIDIKAADAGITFEDIASAIEREYGAPVSAPDNEFGAQMDWEDIVHRKYFSLAHTQDSYTLMVYNSYGGVNIIRSYDLTEGITETADMDERDKILLGILEDIMLPQDIKLIKQFQIYTDGLGGQLGFTSPYSETDNTVMTYGIDVEDAFNSDNSFRNYTKTCKSMVHEYGHLLSENSMQVDINKKGDLPFIFYPEESYTKTSYIRLFYDKFVKDIDDAYGIYYESCPDYFVDKYAANNTSEDFAETFMIFVLTDKPEDDGTGAAQKILFFYDFEEMTTLRDYIRNNLKI